MKKLFQKSGALTMAFLMLFSTMSFAVNKHYCGEVLVEQTVFEKTKSCCAGMHDSSSGDSMEKSQCCNDKKVVVEGQDELKTSFQNFDFEQHLIVATFVYSYINLFENLPKQVVPFRDYSPPLLVYDVSVLNQTFLI